MSPVSAGGQSGKSGYYDWETASTEPATLSCGVDFFRENGYVIFTSFCTQDEVNSLRKRAEEILDNFHNPPTNARSKESASVFTTQDQTRKMDDAYFLSSGAKISCFLEEKQAKDGQKAAINKIGHALHDLDSVFGGFSRQEKVRRVARELGMEDGLLVQSMYILKNARVGGAVRPHRDATFVRGRDGKCLGYWWGLEKADMENGCLWVVPGSHGREGGRRRFIREGGRTRFKGDLGAEDGFGEDEFVAVCVEMGDLVVLDGEVVHKSCENVSERSRHAYSIHVVREGTDQDCWLRRPEELPFRAL